MMQHLWCQSVRRWGFPWLPGCLLWVWEGVPLLHPVCVCFACVALSAWRLLAVWCDEAVCIAVQKAQGQRNMIPRRSVCLSVWLRVLLAGRFDLPDSKPKLANVAALIPWTASVFVFSYLWFGLYVFVPALQCRCRSVDVGRFCCRWSSDCLSSESVGVFFGCASCMLASEFLCLSLDKAAASLRVPPWLCLQCSLSPVGMRHGDGSEVFFFSSYLFFSLFGQYYDRWWRWKWNNKDEPIVYGSYLVSYVGLNKTRWVYLPMYNFFILILYTKHVSSLLNEIFRCGI